MKNMKLMGYEKPTAKANTESKDVNPDTINKLIGAKSPSFNKLPAQPKNENTVKADQDIKIDNHVNDNPYEGKDAKKDMRMEDAYNFLTESYEDSYSTIENRKETAYSLLDMVYSGEADEAVAEMEKNTGTVKKHKPTVGGGSGTDTKVSDGTTDQYNEEDNYDFVDNVTAKKNRIAYGASRLGTLVGGKGKYAKKVDRRNFYGTLGSAAGEIAAAKNGVDPSLGRMVGDTLGRSAADKVPGATKYVNGKYNKAASYIKSKSKSKSKK